MRHRISRLVAFFAPVFLAACPVAAGEPLLRRSIDGLAVYVQPLPGERIEVRAYLRVGRSTAGSGAVADLIGAWLDLGGSGSLPGAEFAVARTALGATFAAWADGDVVVAEMRVLPQNFHAAARLFADVLMYPAFDAAVEPAARRATAHREPMVPDPLLLQARAWLDPGQVPEAQEEGGAGAAAVASALPTRAAVVELYRERVGVETTVIALSGALSGIDAEQEVRAAFLNFRRAAVPAVPKADHPLSGRAATVARRETAPGRSRLVVARSGVPRAHPDWLALLVGLFAVGLDDGAAADTGAGAGTGRLRLEQPLLGPDLTLVDVEVASGSVEEMEVLADRRLAAMKTRSLPAAAFERARKVLERTLLPPPESPDAGRAYALLEALGLPGIDPASRHRELGSVDAAAVARAATGRFR